MLAFSDLQAEITGELIKRGYPVFTFNQRSVDEILQMIRVLGGIVGCADKGNALADELQRGLQRVRDEAARLPRRPRVYFEEWDDPLISGIRWVEELVEIAGGDPVFPELRRRTAGEGAHRDERAGHCRGARHHHRIVVRQAGPAREDCGAGRMGSDPGGEARADPRDQVRVHPAAGTGGAHRGGGAAAADRERWASARQAGGRPAGERRSSPLRLRSSAPRFPEHFYQNQRGFRLQPEGCVRRSSGSRQPIDRNTYAT